MRWKLLIKKGVEGDEKASKWVMAEGDAEDPQEAHGLLYAPENTHLFRISARCLAVEAWKAEMILDNLNLTQDEALEKARIRAAAKPINFADRRRDRFSLPDQRSAAEETPVKQTDPSYWR